VSLVYFDVGLSLDGCLAGPNARPGNPLGDGGLAIHEWLFRTAAFHETHGSPASVPSGAPSPDDALVRAMLARPGAWILGRRMFDEGEVGWPEEAPFRKPVFVLTHRPRAPWVRPGGTTFHFVTGGVEAALAQAKAAANGKDVRIGGGADTIRQFLRAGLVDEFTLRTAPVLLGAGTRLFEQLADSSLAGESGRIEQTAVNHSPLACHASYRVLRRA
jgi:dihydrofolate reductase